MDLWQLLFDVVTLLGAGALLGGLFARLRQSAIVGYLVAGALLGPNVLHVVHSSDEVLAVSELGVALLLFAIGLEFSWTRLRAMGAVAFGGGAVQIVVTIGVVFGICRAAGLPADVAVALGAMAALSSTACVLRVLTSRGEVESVHGERALGILLVQDVAVVPFVLAVTVLNEGGAPSEAFFTLGKTVLIGAGLVAALFVTFYLVVPRLLASASVRANRELPLLVAVASGLGSSVAAHEAGVSPALGAFVAGMVLAESPFAVQVRSDISSLKTLLLTLFFTAIGMLCNPLWIASNLPLVSVVVVGLVVGKALIVWAALRLFGTRGNTALAAGLALGQLGEFSFVLAGIARGGLLDQDLFLLIVSTTVLTMTITPYLVAWAPKIAARFPTEIALVPRVGETSGANSAIVVGFGPAGRAAAERIAELGYELVIVDGNPSAATVARRLGYHAVTGDALQYEVLEHAGLETAKLVIVTVPDSQIAVQIVQYVRMNAPDARILARARFHRSLDAMTAAGAHVVVDEEHEVGRRIAEACEAARV